MWKRLWQEDDGVLTLEYVMLTSLMVAGTAAGLTSLQNTINNQLTSLSQVLPTITSGANTVTFTTTCQSTGTVTGTGTNVFTRPPQGFAPVFNTSTPVPNSVPLSGL